MQFYIDGYNSSHGIPKQDMDIFPHIRLVTDNFDDYDYETLFRMYYVKSKNSGNREIGKVKILNTKGKITRKNIPISFQYLNESFCSLGQSITYYKRIKGLNSPQSELGREILAALNDIAVFNDIEDKFPDILGIQGSLQRDSEAYHAYRLGHNVFYGISSTIEDIVSFKFKYNKENSREVSFVFNDEDNLPNRINIIVGKNGTGKTKVLSTLASVLSGYSKDASCEVDNRPEFSRYIAISYSVFDNFEKPFGRKFSKNDIIDEKIRICNEIEKQMNKCKIRAKEENDDFDVLYKFFSGWIEETNRYEQKNEFFNSIINSEDVEDIEDGNIFNNRIGSYVYCGLRRYDRIISEEEMFSIFSANLRNVIRWRRNEEWYKVVTEIFDDEHSVISLFENGEINEKALIKENFNKLSSGQKIILYIFTEVIESITKDSLLLIDEPEIHLHPNAISNFMRMLNKLLIEFNSYAIISTHSPIILQEVPSKYVRVFDNNEFYDETLYNECFGENISKIISDVFDVRADESNYKSYFMDKKQEGYSKEEIEILFDNNLSMNAKLYLNYLYEGEIEK